MRRRKPTSYARRHEDDLHKLRVEYNLEVDPLQTGLKEPNDELLREMSQVRDSDVHHTSWLGMELWLIVLVLIVGILAAVFAGWAFVAHYSTSPVS